MRRVLFLSLIGTLSLGLLLAACSSGDNDDSTEPTSVATSDGGQPTASATTNEGEPTAGPTTDDGSSTGGGDVTVELTGALEASWGDGGVATCNSFSGQLNVNISNTVGNEIYALVLEQVSFTPGAYFLPESNSDAATTPGVQIVTPSDPSLQWDMGLGIGDGSVSLGGGSGGAPLFITIDGDLIDKNGGDPVHVTADVTCDVTIA